MRCHLTFFIQFHRISEKILLKVKGGKKIDKLLCIIGNENTVISTEGEVWKIGSPLFSRDMTESGHFRKLPEVSSEHTENIKWISSTYSPHISRGKRRSSIKQYTSWSWSIKIFFYIAMAEVQSPLTQNNYKNKLSSVYKRQLTLYWRMG